LTSEKCKCLKCEQEKELAYCEECYENVEYAMYDHMETAEKC